MSRYAVPTVLIITPNGPVNINLSDYDPAVHKLADEAVTDGQGTPVIPESKKAASGKPKGKAAPSSQPVSVVKLAVGELAGGAGYVVYDENTGQPVADGFEASYPTVELAYAAIQAKMG